MNDIKGWIFVSHSTKDLDPVRRIRDYLETKSHHPLLFFLKCIRDTDELDSLIRREIEARTIFLLCDSPNSRAARWVQREVAFIKSLPDRHYEVVDLTLPWRAQQAILDRLSKHSTVFFSFAHADIDEVSAIYESLRPYDYSIFFERHDLQAGDDYQHRTENAIDEALSKGFFVFFASPPALERPTSFQSYELHRALQQRFKYGVRNVVPVLIGEPSWRPDLPASISDYQLLDLRGMPPLEQAKRLHRTFCNVANESDAHS